MKIYAVSAEIMPILGVNEPQGESLFIGLGLIGVETTSQVRVGKMVKFNLEAESRDAAVKMATEACEKLLANTVVQTYDLSVAEGVGETR